eukprot:5077951-Amphidinium_carterae.1
MDVEDVNVGVGAVMLPDDVTGPTLLPPPVTPHSSSDVSAPPFTFSTQQESDVRPIVMSPEYVAMVRRRFESGHTLEEIGQQWTAFEMAAQGHQLGSGSASSVSPVTLDPATLEATQNNRVDTTNVPQAVDVPVPDDDMMDGDNVQGEQPFDDEPDQTLQEGYTGGEDEAGGEEEAPEIDEEEDWVVQYNNWIPPGDDHHDQHVGETHGRDYMLDRAQFQRRRINEDGDQSWDFRSGSASSHSRNPLSDPNTHDRQKKYDRWSYKEVERKRKEEDEFAEKLQRHYQHPLWRKCYICELQEVVTPLYQPQAPGGPDVTEFYAGERVQMVCTNCLPAHIGARREDGVPYERRIYH